MRSQGSNVLALILLITQQACGLVSTEPEPIDMVITGTARSAAHS